MKVAQKSFKSNEELAAFELEWEPDLILLFISPQYNDVQPFVSDLHDKFKDALITGCSTSGEIMDVQVSDATVSLSAIKFDKCSCKMTRVAISQTEGSIDAGKIIRSNLSGEDLRHILVFSDGLHVNGADLVEGLLDEKSAKISITGGLAGDGADFKNTFVVYNGKVEEGTIVGLGFYGKDLKIGYGSKGGWDSFGIEREVTSSKDNVLYELDGEPALSLYKSFLGSKAAELPGSGLLFPLSMRTGEKDLPVVRTILAVDESEQSLTFAGNIPQGSYVRLMKANIDRLVNGAEQSAETSHSILNDDAQLAILISCVGRRLVLKQLVEEEVEAVRDVLGEQPAITGFYSYGELAPFGKFTECQLHNQTMTITTFSE